MLKFRFAAALAAAGLLAASQVSYAATRAEQSPANSLFVPARLGATRGGFAAGHAIGGGMPMSHAAPMGHAARGGMAMSHPVPMGHGGIARNFAGGQHAFAGHRGVYAHRLHHRRGFGGPFIGLGYYWGSPYDDTGSCYWNCRNAGHGPSYCRAYAYEFCY